MSAQIERLIAAQQWDAAEEAIRRELEQRPADHWLLTRLSTTYYERFQYDVALQYAVEALKIAPWCPLVIWDYAGSLDMLGCKEEAIAAFRRLTRRGIERVAYGDCGEGRRWARGLIADCYFRIALCYRDLGKREPARRALRNHLALRGPNCPTIYPLEEVRRKTWAIQKMV